MLDKTKAILGLIVTIAVLLGYIVKLEHRLTVIEQQNAALQKTINDVDENQRRLMQHLMFD
jgi:redox-regulated HSP33 family molecular chaperone